MQAYETENGRREDLEEPMIELNPYLGAIADQILPETTVVQKTGTYYYQTLQADAAAQTGRSSTAAPTRVNITENSSTFSCTEVIKGYTIPRDSVKTQFRTMARADMKGAKAALRSVMRKRETDVAAAVLVGGSTDILDSFIGAAQDALKSIKRYPGQKALVMSQEIFNRVMNYTEITGRFGLASASVNGVTAEMIIARQPEALKMLLQAIIGVDVVLIGDDDIWYTAVTAYQDRCAVMALPSAEDLSELDEAVFGKTVTYLPDGQEYPFYIESLFDRDDKLNKYDASIWYSLEVMNPAARVILDGIDAGNVITTTTTTTTAA
jgi:hypothetical protein